MSVEPRRPAPKTLTPKDLVEAARVHLVRPVWDLLARGAWCRRQRRHLRLPGHSVVWVRGPAVPWAEWGARRGYFDIERMDGLAYLRALGAPIV
jgi:hypothetical protein